LDSLPETPSAEVLPHGVTLLQQPDLSIFHYAIIKFYGKLYSMRHEAVSRAHPGNPD
jgi:hypothetical protein